MLLGELPSTAILHLPWEQPSAAPVEFPLVHVVRGDGWAECGVVKDAGDDPDVTDGTEIRARVAWAEPDRPSFSLGGGHGVGRITKPGLALPVGEPAINPIPRRMIRHAVEDALAAHPSRPVQVVVSVPAGVELAARTLNARLGILGGISILGTTGVVIPMSADAWTATIDSALDVARAAGLTQVVLSHGRSSEAAAEQLFPEQPEEAFVLMGDHVGYALDAAADRGLSVLLAGQFAKFCKVSAGNFATHVKDSTLHMNVVAELLRGAGFSAAEADSALAANTAREVFHWLCERGDRGVFLALTRRVARVASGRVGGRVAVEALLFDYQKQLLARGFG